MSIRKWFGIKNSGNGHVIVAGSFEPDGTNDPTSVLGEGFTVTRNGATGEYRVTLDQPFQNFVSVVASVERASASADANIVWVGDKSASSKYFDIIYADTADSSTTDFAQVDLNAATDRINFVCIVAQKDIPGAGI